ncbi:hypothetical protein pdam_00020424 [Pocillopora damicornis]|uniref:Prosaposin n=1 Tax=Pocillopora damicornis TaxID=46731 RepID=A0A3M6TM61_POCDA|nr:hypothetical protein pdam_00020424 [Pocillopora damicornis]
MSFASLAFVLFVASASATPLGQERCSWGPSYWCAKYKQAVECNALEHCRAKVWSVKDEVACDVCKELDPLMRAYLEKNTTQTELVTLVEEACEKFAGSYAEVCKSLVDQYEPLLMNTILEYLADPQQACTTLGLCSSEVKQVDAKLIFKPLKKQMIKLVKPLALAAKHKPVVVKSKPVKTSAECILCEFIMDKLDSILKQNATREEIEEALDKVCSYLPSSISSECTQFINQYSDAILQILAQELDPKEVCTALQLCTSQAKAMEKPKIHLPKSNETCEICDTVMTYLKMFLAENETQQEILNVLKQLCSYLPEQLSSECTAIVTEYGPALLNLIAESDPETLCEEIGLCSAFKKVTLKKEGKFCFLGASYWCENKFNAIQCNALKHCTDHVWN